MIFRDPVSPREGRGLAAWRSPDVVAFSRRRPDQVRSKWPGRVQKGIARAAASQRWRQQPSQHQPCTVTDPSAVQPTAIPPFPPLPPGTYVQRRPCSRSGARCCAAGCRLTVPVSAKKTKPPQAAGYPDGAAPPPALGRACGDRDRGRGVRVGGERAGVGPEGATPTTPASLRMLWASAAALAALAAAAFRCAEFSSGRQK